MPTISTISTGYVPIESTVYVHASAQNISNEVQRYVVDVKVVKPGDITFIVEIGDQKQQIETDRDDHGVVPSEATLSLPKGIKSEPIESSIPGNSSRDPITTTPAVVLKMRSPATQDRLLHQGLYPPGLGKVHSYKIRCVSIQSDEKENMYDHPAKRRKL